MSTRNVTPIRSKTARGAADHSAAISTELIKLRSGNIRNAVSRAQSVVQVATGAIDAEVDEAAIREALYVASDLLEDICGQLDEVSIAEPASDEELHELDRRAQL